MEYLRRMEQATTTMPGVEAPGFLMMQTKSRSTVG
jgi:hypothetical protein